MLLLPALHARSQMKLRLTPLSRIAAATDRIGALESAVAQLAAQTARIGDEMERLQHAKQS